MAYKGGDQHFLQRFIWPLIKSEDLLQHDSYLCERYSPPTARGFPTARRGAWDMAARIEGARKFNHYVNGTFWWHGMDGDEAVLYASTSAGSQNRGHLCPKACRPSAHRKEAEWEAC